MYKFQSPVPKRCSLKAKPCLPIFNDSGETVQYSAKFNGFNVVVENQDAMTDLYTMGYFGKGSLSTGYPSFNMKEHEFPLESSEPNESSDSGNRSQEITNPNRTINGKETLHLTLEEAFFLSYGLNCLNVYQDDRLIPNQCLWEQFMKAQSNFVVNYIVYHYFRTKGWVVRSGIKFGGDFVLYKQGPPFYHASYVVIAFSNSSCEQDDPCFEKFLTLYRSVEVVKKELLLCRVTIPDNFDAKNLDNLKACTVSEFIFKRWVPAENREMK